MSHPVRLTALAEADIADAFRWYEAKKPGLGLEFFGRVEEAIQIIAENPTLHARLIEDARRIPLKQFPFALWYVVADDGSVVIGCPQGKRDLSVAKARYLHKPQGPS